MKFIATVIVGLFTGAMLFIAISVVPYWSSLPVAAFQAAFKGQASFIGNFMLLMLNASIISTIICCFLTKQRRSVIFAAACLILILPLYKFLHEPLNHKLLSDTPLNAIEGVRLIAEWKLGHWVRLSLGGLSYLALLLGGHK